MPEKIATKPEDLGNCQICNENKATKTVQEVKICPSCFFKVTRGQLKVPNLKRFVGKPEAIEPPTLPASPARISHPAAARRAATASTKANKK